MYRRFLPAVLSKHQHEISGCYGRTDDSGHVRAHCMHKKEVVAPIRWSLSGKGSQELFLLTPQVDGFISVNPETFRRRFETVWK